MASAREQGRQAYRAIAANYGFLLGQTGIRQFGRNPYGKLTGDHLAWRRGFEGEATKFEHELLLRGWAKDWGEILLPENAEPGGITPIEVRSPKSWLGWLRNWCAGWTPGAA